MATRFVFTAPTTVDVNCPHCERPIAQHRLTARGVQCVQDIVIHRDQATADRRARLAQLQTRVLPGAAIRDRRRRDGRAMTGPRRPPQPDCYDYVRRYYGVPAFIGMRVRVQDRDGVLVKSRGDQYLYIRFDGETRSKGPYHPRDGITYLLAESKSVGAGATPLVEGATASAPPSSSSGA